MAKKRDRYHPEEPKPTALQRFENTWLAAFLYTLIDIFFSYQTSSSPAASSIPLFHMTDRLGPRSKGFVFSITLMLYQAIMGTLSILLYRRWKIQGDLGILEGFCCALLLGPGFMLLFWFCKLVLIRTRNFAFLRAEYESYRDARPGREEPYAIFYMLSPKLLFGLLLLIPLPLVLLLLAPVFFLFYACCQDLLCVLQFGWDAFPMLLEGMCQNPRGIVEICNWVMVSLPGVLVLGLLLRKILIYPLLLWGHRMNERLSRLILR